ncbi:MAG: hypothetical protein J0L77_03600 [Alphaproteobacteria bacterium]|nr:hypothetical protein [Alphaproteobacteria bacterium]
MKIFRISSFLSLGIAGVLAGLLYWTSQSVQHEETILLQSQQAISFEQETLQVLGTEWDYLTRPQRLEELARERLNMVPPHSGEDILDTVSELPDAPLAETIFIEQAQTAKAPSVSPTISNAERESFGQLIDQIGGEEVTP